MYEPTADRASALRRIITVALILAVIVAVVWVSAWLLFFRDSQSSNKSSDKGLQTQQAPHKSDRPSANTSTPNSGSSSPSNTQPSGGQASGGTGAANTPAPPTAVGGSGAAGGDTSQPSQLADTGAGDVLLPVAAAAAAGTGLYYIRLHRKLNARS
jgi:hypothetical protein